MKNIFWLAAILFLASCSLNVDKITKKMLKKDSQQQLEYLKGKVFENSKSDTQTKIMALDAISINEFYSVELNEYLRDVLFPDENNAEFKKQIFDIIVKINLTENSSFFWELVINNDQYRNDAISALKKLGLDGLDVWKEQMLDPALKIYVDQIFERQTLWVHQLITYYLTLSESQTQPLIEYLLENQKLVIEDIVERINNEEIDNYEIVNNIVELFDSMTLPDYDILIKSESETVFEILKQIYNYYIEEGFINLHILYTATDDLAVKLRIIKIHQFLANENYINNLEKYLVAVESDTEQKALIDALINMYDELPAVFYPLLAESDFFFNFKNYIPKYLTNQFTSFETAFNETSNIGKVNILDYLFKNHFYQNIDTLIVNLDIKRNISEEMEFLWNFIVTNSVKYDYYVPNLNLIVTDMLIVDTPVTLNIANMIVGKNFDVFEESLIYELSKPSASVEKWSILFENFIHAVNDTTSMFLVEKMKEMSGNNENIIVAKMAQTLAENKHFNYLKLAKDYEFEPDKWLLALLACNMKTKRENIQEINRYFIDYYYEFSNQDRLKIISYMKQQTQKELLRFLIENYDGLPLIEKKAINSSLANFENFDLINNQLRKLLLFGNNDELIFVERFIETLQVDSELVKSSLKSRYFRDFDFSGFDEISHTMIDSIDTLRDSVSQIYRKSMEYNTRFSPVFSISQCYPSETLKAVADSIIFYSEITNNPLVKEDKLNSAVRLKTCFAEYDSLLIAYSKYLGGISENDNFMNAFFIKVVETHYEDELEIGRMILLPGKEMRFVKLLLEVENKGLLDVDILPENFILTSKQTSYAVSQAGDIFFSYIKQVNPYQIKTGKNAYINLYFAVAYDDREFELTYTEKDQINIVDPILIVPYSKEYRNGVMQEY